MTIMAPTSDERREVEERLRKTRGIMAFVDALGIDPDGDWTWEDVSRRVADLIDPTCGMEDAGDVPASVKDNLITFFCSECGSPIYNDINPSYCPYCGARVTKVVGVDEQ